MLVIQVLSLVVDGHADDSVLDWLEGTRLDVVLIEVDNGTILAEEHYVFCGLLHMDRVQIFELIA
jgi:hypothetical protein